MLPANLVTRLAAFWTDLLFVGWPVVFVLPFMLRDDRSPFSEQVGTICLLACLGLMLVNMMLSLQDGRSVGKRVLGLHVVNMDGQPLLFVQRLVRSLSTAFLWLLSALGASLLDFLMMVFTGRALHDRWSGSQVMVLSSPGGSRVPTWLMALLLALPFGGMAAFGAALEARDAAPRPVVTATPAPPPSLAQTDVLARRAENCYKARSYVQGSKLAQQALLAYQAAGADPERIERARRTLLDCHRAMGR